MPIVHKLLPDGGFVAGDTETRITCYAYPTSSHAVSAKKKPQETADEMIAGERSNAFVPSDIRLSTDERNWKLLA